MSNHSLQLQNKNPLDEIPEEWKPRYLIKRIKDEPIEINQKTLKAVHEAMASNKRFVIVREYTVMINSISGINPRWGEPNVPPRPSDHYPSKQRSWDVLFSNPKPLPKPFETIPEQVPTNTEKTSLDGLRRLREMKSRQGGIFGRE